jgi:hypothetical protein
MMLGFKFNYCPGWRVIKFTASRSIQCSAGTEGLDSSSEVYAIYSKKDWLGNDGRTPYVA